MATLEPPEQCFVVNSVPADSAESHKPRAILISVICAKAYDVLSDLCSPIPPSEKTSAQLTTILKNHFAPKKLVIANVVRVLTSEASSVPLVATLKTLWTV